MRGAVFVALGFLALGIVLSGCMGENQPQPPTPLQREIRELAEVMESTHPDLFHDVSRRVFRAEAEKLAATAPELSRDELVVGLMRIVALPGARDGHTPSIRSISTRARSTCIRCGSTTSPAGPTSSARSPTRT